MTIPTGITTHEPGTGVFSRLLGWLTAGYPDGIPPQDRFAVVALLKRRLSDHEVKQIVHELTGGESSAGTDRVITDAEIATLSHRVLSERPGENDLHRVSARLAAAGWPLEGEAVLDDDAEGEH